MQILRYNPRKDITRLGRDLDRVFGSTGDWSWPALFQDPSTVDMYTENGQMILEATLPGFKKEEIKINTSGDAIDITAERDEKEESETKREYLQRESCHSYHRQIILPDNAKVDEAQAEFLDGTLKITMPLREQIESKTLMIK